MTLPLAAGEAAEDALLEAVWLPFEQPTTKIASTNARTQPFIMWWLLSPRGGKALRRRDATAACSAVESASQLRSSQNRPSPSSRRKKTRSLEHSPARLLSVENVSLGPLVQAALGRTGRFHRASAGRDRAIRLAVRGRLVCRPTERPTGVYPQGAGSRLCTVWIWCSGYESQKGDDFRRSRARPIPVREWPV